MLWRILNFSAQPGVVRSACKELLERLHPNPAYQHS